MILDNTLEIIRMSLFKDLTRTDYLNFIGGSRCLQTYNYFFRDANLSLLCIFAKRTKHLVLAILFGQTWALEFFLSPHPHLLHPPSNGRALRKYRVGFIVISWFSVKPCRCAGWSRYLNRGKAFPTRWHVRPANTQLSWASAQSDQSIRRSLCG